jgi:superfamily II DNA or RNA helicase
MDFPALLKQYGIDRQKLRHAFGDQTISRGVAYKWQGAVGDMDVSQNLFGELEIRAKVKGQNVYYTEVTLHTDLETEVNSFCSCPVADNCKHGAALLYAYLDALEQQHCETIYPDDKSVVDLWLDSLAEEATEQTINKGRAKSKFRVVYHLAKNDQNELFVRSYKSRELKHGGYGKGAKLSLHEIKPDSYYQPDVLYTELDEEIASILEGGNSYRYQYENVYPLKGDLGVLVLDKLLQTGRCYWQTHMQDGENVEPLHKSNERGLSLVWQTTDRLKFLEMDIDPPVSDWFCLQQLYYIDEQQHSCGLLIHPHLPLSKLLKLLQAPPVPVDKAFEVSQRLVTTLPTLDVPTPTDLGIEIKTIDDAKPVPDLRLRSVETMEGGRLYLASLSFYYNDIHLKPIDHSDISVFLKDNIRYRIHRDMQAEAGFISALDDVGLMPARQLYVGEFDLLDLTMQAESLQQRIMQWDEFVEHIIPSLEDEGWKITFDNTFNLDVQEADNWYGEIEENEGGTWFQMSLGFQYNGQNLNILPLLVDVLKQGQSPEEVRDYLQSQDFLLVDLGESRWVKLPTERVLGAVETLVELFDTESLDDEGRLVFSRHQGMHYNELLNDPSLTWKGADELQELSNRIRDFEGIQTVVPPDNLQAQLRDYQQFGLNWLQFLRDYQFSGILADDMGLGKTLQALTHLLLEKQQGRLDKPCLIVAPTSLMGNWRREAQTFTPDLKVITLHGADRHSLFEHIPEYDLVLTTYPLILRDQDFYQEQAFYYVVLDEAQAIKNAKSKTSQAIFQLQAQHRLCLTGTPMENHLGEIWSMYHFLMPGYLGTQERFTRLFRSPIEKHADEIRQRQLRKRVEPFMLRRTKDVVATELPPKTEIIRTVALEKDQQDLYETVRLAMDKKVREEISKKGLARSQIMILDALLKLRQVCCDPSLVKLAKAKQVKSSAKLDLLMTLLPEMVEEGRKVLLFSQFVSMLNIIESRLKKQKITYTKLTGQTRKREEAIDAFQEGDASVFLISLKAGGTGLNLTAADTVIHYDPWWNPAVEDQATDRAYRIGQDKPVFVYKLLTENTVEERILALQSKKKALADGLYAETKDKGANFDQNELMDLLRPIG